MRIPDKPAPAPGEWQEDEYGKRYRMIGALKEYEMEINGIPQSTFYANRKAQQERDKARYEAERKAAAEQLALMRTCPFRDANSMKTSCSREACALFLNGCSLAKTEPAKDTKGLQCPLNRYLRECRTDCALYKGGCTLTGIISNIESEV